MIQHLKQRKVSLLRSEYKMNLQTVIVSSLLLCIYAVYVVTAAALKNERTIDSLELAKDQNRQSHGLENILLRAKRNGMPDNQQSISTTNNDDLEETTANKGDQQETTSSNADLQETTTNNVDPKETTANIGDLQETTTSNVDLQETTTNNDDKQQTTANISDLQETTTSNVDLQDTTTNNDDKQETTANKGDVQEKTTKNDDQHETTTNNDNQKDSTTTSPDTFGVSGPLCYSFGCGCIKPRNRPCCTGYKYDRRSRKCKKIA